MFRRYAISEIGDIISGATPKTTVPDNFGGEIPWLTPADLSGYTGKYISHGARNLTRQGYDSCSTHLMPAGTVLLSSRAPIGYVAIAKNEICTNQGFKSIVPKTFVNSEFLYYQLESLKNTLQNLGSGTTFKELSAKKLATVQVVIPSLEEQKSIVSKIEELFSKLDASVAELKTAKEKLKVYRQAVLKEAFTGFTQKGLVEISEIVEDIRIGPFGTMLHKADYVSGGVPVINPQHIKKLSIIPSEKVTVSQEKYVELAPYQLKENDIIMGRRGEMGRAAAITKVEAGWICGTGSILFRLKPEYDATFYSQILSSPDAVHYLEDHATGTTMKNLNESIVKHIPVPKVTRQMQEEIVSKSEEKTSICDSIEQTIDASLQQAEALRQSILKQAFEGGL